MQPALEVIHEYYKAFSTLDSSAIASYYCEPSMTIAPQGVLSAANHAALTDSLAPIVNSLKARDTGGASSSSRTSQGSAKRMRSCAERRYGTPRRDQNWNGFPSATSCIGPRPVGRSRYSWWRSRRSAYLHAAVDPTHAPRKSNSGAVITALGRNDLASSPHTSGVYNLMMSGGEHGSQESRGTAPWQPAGRQIRDEATLSEVFRRFERWQAVRATLQFLTFAAGVWALAANEPGNGARKLWAR
jgi:hypothetical protein